jgi:hypothetical protein
LTASCLCTTLMKFNPLWSEVIQEAIYLATLNCSVAKE